MRQNVRKIFSLGTGNRGLEEFRDILLFFRIQLLVDVRRFPRSRFEHFIMENLEVFCGSMGISYRRFIASRLAEMNWQVIHIVDRERVWEM